jgi:paraquat-inducible protein A
MSEEHIEDPESLRACPTCGLVQSVPALKVRERACCPRCAAVVLCGTRLASGNGITLAASLAALILYPLAISMPIMRLERFGHSTLSSVLGGSLRLLQEGEVFIGALIFICSVVLPLAKLLGLFVLCFPRKLAARHRAFFYHAIEFAGRWGMLDVMLVAIVIAWVKIGDLVQVAPGPGIFAFAGLVAMSLVASASFDPHTIWRESLRPSTASV